MKIRRDMTELLLHGAAHFPAVVITGPRRAGKTMLLRHTFPRASYALLEDPDVLARVKADPRGWLDGLRLPVIIDEIQNAPELFGYIRSRIDAAPGKQGQWLITGSQQLGLMQGVTESMAGRAAVLELWPLSYQELGKWSLLRGGFPEVVLRPRAMRLWFSSYLQTYLERDVRALLAVKDLSTFRRFLSLCASRNGQSLNKSALAAPLGVSVPTIGQWLNVLETTGHILFVPPYFENFGKRLTKSPKLYWIDTGLLSFLLGIETERELERSPFLGSLFEGFVATEIVKNRANRGRPRELYYFRDEQGLEVDFVAQGQGGKLRLIEVKWSKTVTPEMARPMLRLAAAMGGQPVESVVVHRASPSCPPIRTVARGVRAATVEEFLSRPAWR